MKYEICLDNCLNIYDMINWKLKILMEEKPNWNKKKVNNCQHLECTKR